MSSQPAQSEARTPKAAPRLQGARRSRQAILRPGHNCWRVVEAARASLLIDSADYYRRLCWSLERAQRSIVILGWDFDGRIMLCPDRPDDARPLGQILRALVEEREELEVRILVWSNAVLHAPGDSAALLLGSAWQDHPRLHLHLDTKHPFYASHHQKVVVIDDSVAFAGGIDLTIRRWDSSAHRADDASRVQPDGTRYEPVHDLQMAVEGEAARALGDLARQRWKVALGEAFPEVAPTTGCWPDDLDPDFTNVPVAISRTAPGWGANPPVGEQANLTADAIAAARHTIYAEAQYLSSMLVRNALASRLAQPEGPEIVMIVTPFSRGLFERTVLAANRDRIMRRLLRLPGGHRLRFYYPVVPPADPQSEGDCKVMVHAKLMIIDDTLLRVGSGNLSNRSMGLDTECDLAIEATDDETRRTIADVRSRLLGEHLGVESGRVTRAIEQKGSMIAAIETLNGGPRCLRCFDPGAGPTSLAFGTRLVDPARPWEPLWFLSRRGA